MLAAKHASFSFPTMLALVQVRQSVYVDLVADVLAGGQSMLICLDEVQIAYHLQRTGSADFWNSLKRLERGQLDLTAPHDTRVIMAAAYGSKRSAAKAAVSDSLNTIPVDFENPNMVVTIFPSPSPGGASLRLAPTEWDELWNNYLAHTGLGLAAHIKEHVGSMSAWQVSHMTHLGCHMRRSRQRCVLSCLPGCCGGTGRAADSHSRLLGGRARQ